MTLPSWSTSRRTSMRPSSGGSSRISNRFAISTAIPASGIAAGCDPGCEVRAFGPLDACPVAVSSWVALSIVGFGPAMPGSPESAVAPSARSETSA